MQKGIIENVKEMGIEFFGEIKFLIFDFQKWFKFLKISSPDIYHILSLSSSSVIHQREK